MEEGAGLFESRVTRRRALQAGAGAAATLAVTPGLLGRGFEALAAATPGPGPYGALGAPDAQGLRLAPGFTSRVIARALTPVENTIYPWHIFPDGMGTFDTGDGGFILVSNSEVPLLGGASAIRFGPNGQITSAYQILAGTSTNCSGGITPWGTWLSCEETDNGKVWECDPLGIKAAVPHAPMGVFKHEACCVDPVGKRAYLTEDLGDGCLYRFTPTAYPDLSAGTLDVAIVAADGTVNWVPVPDPTFSGGTPTRNQVAGATRFRRGEGMWYDGGFVYFATTQDDRVYAYDPARNELAVLYDGVALGDAAALHDTDNVTVSARSGELFVCEDHDDLQICVITPEGEVAAFAQAVGADHDPSELTGPVFDPTGTRLYFSSQRAGGGTGIVYEITGPFRTQRPQPASGGGGGGDKDGPNIAVKVLGKPSTDRLEKKGLSVRVEVSGEKSPPVKVDAILEGPLGKRAGASRKSRLIADAKEKDIAAADGKAKLKLKSKESASKLLRDSRGPVRAKLVVTAEDQRGNVTRKVKRVRFD